jgi:hypothetical protein
MKMNRLFQMMLVLLVFVACDSPKVKTPNDSDVQIKLHKATVKEVIQTTKYTYLYVNEEQKEYWTAISKQDFMPGEEFFYMDDVVTLMENFHSQELDRDFPSILFISQISSGHEKPSSPPTATMQQPASMPQSAMSREAHSGRKTVPAVENISVKPVRGGVSIAELYANKATYSGKNVKVKGSVVKVNIQIMGRNWVHLQDGSKHGNEYDLTCTTQAAVEVGDIVTFEGVIALDKDFTSGYFYPLIMEDAVVVK